MQHQNGTNPRDLENKLKRLEEIVGRVEHAGSGLAEALQLVEEGVALSEEIDEELSRCDERVQTLIERIRPPEA